MSSTKLPIRPWLPVGPQVVTSTLSQLGAIAFPVLKEEYTEELACLAESLIYEKQPSVYGARAVRQDVESTWVVPGSELDNVASHLENELRHYFCPSLFERRLEFNFRNIQRYAHGTLGIDPHYDESVNRNLIVLLNLRGSGRFTVYESLDGPVRVTWNLVPGSLLLMVAPGFCGYAQAQRPVHGVSDIVGNPYRYLLGLRQHVSSARC